MDLFFRCLESCQISNTIRGKDCGEKRNKIGYKCDSPESCAIELIKLNIPQTVREINHRTVGWENPLYTGNPSNGYTASGGNESAGDEMLTYGLIGHVTQANYPDNYHQLPLSQV